MDIDASFGTLGASKELSMESLASGGGTLESSWLPSCDPASLAEAAGRLSLAAQAASSQSTPKPPTTANVNLVGTSRV
jgi:hypothetical protein